MTREAISQQSTDVRRARIMRILQRLDAVTRDVARFKAEVWEQLNQPLFSRAAYRAHTRSSGIDHALVGAVVILFGQEQVPQLRLWDDEQLRQGMEELRRTCPLGAEQMHYLIERRRKEARTEKGMSATEQHVGLLIDRLSGLADGRPCNELDDDHIDAVEAQLDVVQKMVSQAREVARML